LQLFNECYEPLPALVVFGFGNRVSLGVFADGADGCGLRHSLKVARCSPPQVSRFAVFVIRL
jgi:hypothetical protein